MSQESKTEIPMITLTIDGQSVSVPKGTTVYTAAQKLKIDIPVFCYIDRMPPFGACRMCLVEVEKAPKLQASCTLEATEGMVVHTMSEKAIEGRKGIVELLLINHPLDCPICDRGGECPLQDHTMQHGPGKSRFYEEKRRFKKPLPLGPVLMLDRERCIVCARCTRFSDIISGDHALEFIERGYRTEVGTPDGGPAESKFIGNTIKICPVGALTSQVYRFRARPWDNKPAESTCTLCPVGCSLILDNRDGEIMRTRSRENPDVNDIWLCDKGWFGYEFTNHPDRLTTPLIRKNGQLEPASWEEALTAVAEKMQAAKASGKLAAFGGNPLTLEENYLLQQLMRHGLGTQHLDHRVGMPIHSLDEETVSPGMQMSIGNAEKLSYAVLLGLDLTEEFPVIWLRLRQAINKEAKVLFFGHFAPEIAPYLTKTMLHAPGQELHVLRNHLSGLKDLGEKGALFVGKQYLSSPNRKAICSELLRLCRETPELSLNILEGRGNSTSARLAGMRPDLGPIGERLAQPGKNVIEVLEASAQSGWDTFYVVGADPASKYPSKLWQEARSKLGSLIVQDLFLTETAKQADIVLPSASFVEKGGTFINIEGRIQTLQPGKALPENVMSDSEIFVRIAEKLDVQLSIDPIFFENVKAAMLPGIVSEVKTDQETPPEQNGTLKATFAHALFDNGVRMKHNTHVLQLAKESFVRLHPDEAVKRNLECGCTARIKANGQVISAKVKLDRNVSQGTVVIPLGFDNIATRELGANLLNGLTIELERS